VANFCPACGKPLEPNPVQPGETGYGTGSTSPPLNTPVGELRDNIAGMLAYITVVPAIVFLVMEPYNRRPFVRFHSFQCLFLTAACIVACIALMMLGMIPFLGVLVLLLGPLLWFLTLIVALVCLLKAYQGHMWKLPVIGDLAEKQANATQPGR
jgi:uncharacterized membrane protein